MKKWLVLLNGAAGTAAKEDAHGELAERLRRLLSNHGVRADVRPLPAAELTDAARAAATNDGYDAILAGGGDGTLNAVASGLAGTGVPFGVLPLGTHNHFAKDLETPLDLDDAIAATTRGEAVDLPVGEVNGRLFLNFSGIGLHPRVIKHRDAQRKSLDRGKWLAMTVALARGLLDFPLTRVTLTAGGQTLRRLTPSVIVCVNPHQMKAFGVENASYPDRRVLNIYVARARGRLGLVWLMVRAAFGGLERTARFEARTATDLRVDTPGRTVRVSIDGEVIDLEPPLTYKVQPSILKVIVPKKAD